MSTPIFLLVLGEGFTEAWYQLSKQEQDDLWAQVQDVDRRAGAVWHILCDSRWADESLFDWARDRVPGLDSYRHRPHDPLVTLRAARGTKINGSDPALPAICTSYPACPTTPAVPHHQWSCPTLDHLASSTWIGDRLLGDQLRQTAARRRR